MYLRCISLPQLCISNTYSRPLLDACSLIAIHGKEKDPKNARAGDVFFPDGILCPPVNRRNIGKYEFPDQFVMNGRPIWGVQCKRADFPEDFVPKKSILDKKLQVALNCPVCTDDRILKYHEAMEEWNKNPVGDKPTLEATKHDDCRIVIQYALFRRLQKLVPATHRYHRHLVFKIFKLPEWLTKRKNRAGRECFLLEATKVQHITSNVYSHLTTAHSTHPKFDELMEMPIIQRMLVKHRKIMSRFQDRKKRLKEEQDRLIDGVMERRKKRRRLVKERRKEREAKARARMRLETSSDEEEEEVKKKPGRRKGAGTKRKRGDEKKGGAKGEELDEYDV